MFGSIVLIIGVLWVIICLLFLKQEPRASDYLGVASHMSDSQIKKITARNKYRWDARFGLKLGLVLIALGVAVQLFKFWYGINW